MRYQSTFSDVEYLNRKRISKREEFLDSMNCQGISCQYAVVTTGKLFQGGFCHEM